jgi:hypothetical protein
MAKYADLHRVTVSEAAQKLGVKEQAIRKRIQRETIPHDKDETGRVYVYFNPIDTLESEGTSTRDNMESQVMVEGLLEAKDETISELRTQLEYLRQEGKRKDAIIMSLTQRIPELEPAREYPPKPREPTVSASDEQSKGAVPPESSESEIRQSWWRRLFQ